MTLDGWLAVVALLGIAGVAASVARARYEDSTGLSPEWSSRLGWGSALVCTVAGVALAVWGLLR